MSNVVLEAEGLVADFVDIVNNGKIHNPLKNVSVLVKCPKCGATLKTIKNGIDTYLKQEELVENNKKQTPKFTIPKLNRGELDELFDEYNKEKLFSVGLAARNYGVQCVKYYDSDNREILPFNLQVGFSKELAHAPFRFSVTYDRLNDWNLDYYRQAKRKDVVGEEPDSDKIKGGDMFFRHLIFGVDVLLSKNFYVEMAYNHRRKREFTLAESRGANGFSFGAGLKVYAFSLDLAYSLYAPAANTFTLSLTADLEKFIKK